MIDAHELNRLHIMACLGHKCTLKPDVLAELVAEVAISRLTIQQLEIELCDEKGKPATIIAGDAVRIRDAMREIHEGGKL